MKSGVGALALGMRKYFLRAHGRSNEMVKTYVRILIPTFSCLDRRSDSRS